MVHGQQRFFRTFLVTMVLVCCGLSEGRAETAIPQKLAPDACRSDRSDRNCRRWYHIGQSRVIILKGVQFESGSARLTPESKEILNGDIEKIKRKSGTILIIGHTDSQGDSDSNQRLSETRAQAVMNYFAVKGVNPSRMKAKGMGENKPIASNDTEEGRALNRRIEVHLD